MSEHTGIDLQRVLREIDEEVKARRASGDFPPGMERELDLIFARFAPTTVSDDDFEGMLEVVDRTAFVDTDPPMDGRIPGITVLKRVEHKLLGWWFRYVGQQVSAFAGVVVQVLRSLGRRVAVLEEALPGTNPQLLDTASRARRPATAGTATTTVVTHLAGVSGRVLVADAGDGDLLRQLVAHGLDAYGIEPRLDLAETAALEGLDVRADDALDHLTAVEDHALGGVVLVGVVDRTPLGSQLVLADQATRILADDGVLVIVGSDPSSWGVANPVEADLAPGRPLHAATWGHLLEERGLRSVVVVEAGAVYAVTARR